METGPWLKSHPKEGGAGDQIGTPDLGEWFVYYTALAPIIFSESLK